MSEEPVEKLDYLIGYSGKIPSKGDFVQSSLDQDYSEIWNEWLQSIIGVSREQLGDGWLNTYLTSPIWNFALSAGVSGKQSMCGTLLPSVDKVGRYFPFTLAHRFSGTAIDIAANNLEWFTALNEQALMALDPDNFNLEDFASVLSGMEVEEKMMALKSNNDLLKKPMAGRKLCWHLGGDFGLQNKDCLIEVLDVSLSKLFGCYSVWWTTGSEKVEPCMLVSEGLPDVGRYSAMLDGDWGKWGWQSHDFIKK